MPDNQIIDYKMLFKMVKNGTHQKEIMKAFKFKTAAQLKNHYLTALMEEGNAPKLKSGRVKKPAVTQGILVNKRGSLIIPKELVQDMEFTEGDKFKIRKTKSGISLQKM